MADDVGPITVLDPRVFDLRPLLPLAPVDALEGWEEFDETLDFMSRDLAELEAMTAEEWREEFEGMELELAEGLAEDSTGIDEEEFSDPQLAEEETD